MIILTSTPGVDHRNCCVHTLRLSDEVVGRDPGVPRPRRGHHLWRGVPTNDSIVHVKHGVDLQSMLKRLFFFFVTNAPAK